MVKIFRRKKTVFFVIFPSRKLTFYFNFLVYFLDQEGENVAKLEKADILELTVRHLHTLRRQNVLGTRADSSYAEKFKAGFRHCAAEVSNFLGVVDQDTSVQVLKHLNTCINHLDRSANPAPFQPHQQPANRPAIQIQSPNQINAQATGSRHPSQMHWSPNQQQFYSDKQKHQMMLQRPISKPMPMHYSHSGRSANSTPESLSESSTRINTPPISPKIDIDDSSVWRPW